MRHWLLVLGFILLSLPLVGCGAGRVEIVRDRGSDMFNVMVELNEDEMAQLVAQALSAGANPLLRDPVADFQDGQIEVTGTHQRRDGGGNISGRIVIVPSVQDSVLAIEVTEVDIEGVSVSDERIAQFNERLAARLGSRLDQRPRDITMTGVTVTDTVLTLTFNVSRVNEG